MLLQGDRRPTRMLPYEVAQYKGKARLQRQLTLPLGETSRSVIAPGAS